MPRSTAGIPWAVSKELLFALSKLQLRFRSTLPRQGQVTQRMQGVAAQPGAPETLPASWPFCSSLTPPLRGKGERTRPSVNMTNDVLSRCAPFDPLPTGRADSAPTTTSLSGGQPADGTRSLARAAVCGRPGVLGGHRARTKTDEAPLLAMKGAAHYTEELTTLKGAVRHLRNV